jgi:ATP synthase protein I
VSGALIEIDKQDRIRAFRLVGFQALVVVAIALSGLVAQRQIALSLLAGGAIGLAGSAWLALLAFRPSATRPAKEILASFYIGEIGRFLIVMVLFILAFKQLAWLAEPRNALMLFLAFIASQLAIAVAPQLVNKAER